MYGGSAHDPPDTIHSGWRTLHSHRRGTHPPHISTSVSIPSNLRLVGWNGNYKGAGCHLHKKPETSVWVGPKKGQGLGDFQILLSCEGISSVSLMTKWLGRAALTVTPLGFPGFDPWWGD